jgi:hypothetical protein
MKAVRNCALAPARLTYWQFSLPARRSLWFGDTLPDMKTFFALCLLVGLALVSQPSRAAEKIFADHFPVPPKEWTNTGGNDYIRLEPGYTLVLEGKEDDKPTVLTITVLDQTQLVAGVETRVVEERETQNGQLVEVSRNFLAATQSSKDVYYFGEEVDIYQNGKVTGHEGSWQAGDKGAKYGLMMPGSVRVGATYYQELAGKVARDRAEIISITETIVTPAGKFINCVKTEETTPLEPGHKEYKLYAPGVGLVQDGNLVLVRKNSQSM